MTDEQNQLEQAAAEQSRTSLLREIWGFLSITKKWWLLPIIVVFGLLGVLIMFSGTAAAPFIYTLF